MKLTITAASAAANTNGLAAGVSGASWALTATDSGDSLAHKITITGGTATNHSAKTVVVSGSLFGSAQSETINLPNGTATVTTTKYYSSVDTPMTPSATIGSDTMDIGWAAASVSDWVYPNTKVEWGGMGIGCEVTAGSPTYGVQVGFGGGAIDHATITGETTSQYGECAMPVAALRLVFTAAGSVEMNAIQAGA